jgi:chromosome segregation ATPase
LARKQILQLACSPYKCNELSIQLESLLEKLENLQKVYEAELTRAQQAEQGLQEIRAELAEVSFATPLC